MKPNILCIESSSEICSVAINTSDETYLKESNEARIHSSVLTILIEELLGSTGINAEQLDAVALSSGPGSYTGLRIGSSTAKGMCYALDIPLIAIETFEILRQGYLIQNSNSKRTIMAMIDARRMEVYMKSWDYKGEIENESQSLILDENFENEINTDTVYIGDGARKLKDLNQIQKDLNLVELKPRADFMTDLANDYYSHSKFENLAYFEPFYLKEFYTTRPKKRS